MKKRIVKIVSFVLCFFLFIYLFLLVNIIINRNPSINKQTQYDYILVLGSAIDNNKPGSEMINRLNKTIDISKTYQNIPIILSGGLTGNNNYSEAYVMNEYLSNKVSNDLLLEEDSLRTKENFINVNKIINCNSNIKVLVITSDFHIYRARNIAKRYSSCTYDFINSNNSTNIINYLMEPFSFIKNIFI